MASIQYECKMRFLGTCIVFSAWYILVSATEPMSKNQIGTHHNNQLDA